MEKEKLRICKYRKYCGGCQLQGKSYEKQLSLKQARMENLLGRIHKVNPILGMEDPYHYRNKVNVTFGFEDNRVLCGNYLSNTHQIVEVDSCMINDVLSDKIIQSIKEFVIRHKVNIFDENSLKGCIRHVLIRSTNKKEYMVVLVTGTNTMYKGDLLVKELTKKYPQIKTIVQNVNRKHTSMVLGNQNHVLYGKGYVEDELLGCTFQISASSFYQINKRQTAILYSTALNFADFKGDETVIDAYCGTGTIGILASSRVKKVLGVEVNEQAIQDAKKNARINKVENIEFVAEDAGNYMRSLAKKKEKIDAVILDPPRSGADQKFLDSLRILKPEKIIYVSCGPESLRGNLYYLTKHGYQVKEIQPVDMFPLSSHVETVCRLTKI